MRYIHRNITKASKRAAPERPFPMIERHPALTGTRRLAAGAAEPAGLPRTAGEALGRSVADGWRDARPGLETRAFHAGLGPARVQVHATEPAQPDRTLSETARLCRALSWPTRLKIVGLLLEGERSTAELAQATGESQPNFSLHINILVRAGVVGRKRGKRGFIYSLATDGTGAECRRLFAILCTEAAKMAAARR